MPGYISDVRQRVSALEAAQRYGLKLVHNKAHCIHGNRDTNPSMTFRPRDGMCMCWACAGKAVSSIDIAQHQLNLSPLEAAKRLDSDFGLHLWKDTKAPNGEPTQAPQPRQRQMWEVVRDIKAERVRLVHAKQDIEAQFGPDGPTDTQLDMIDPIVADINKIDLFLMNIDAEDTDI